MTTKQRVERVLSGRGLEIRVPGEVDRQDLAVRLTGLAHDILAELSQVAEPEVAEPEVAEPEDACPTCGAADDDPCLDTRPGHRRRPMRGYHPNRGR